MCKTTFYKLFCEHVDMREASAQALIKISQQMLSNELQEDLRDGADYKLGYDEIIKSASAVTGLRSNY